MNLRKLRKSTIPERISIHSRPEYINNRSEPGHFEGDLTFFKGSQSTNISVLTERQSRYSFLTKNETKTSKEVCTKVFNVLAKLPPEMRKSTTLDNGTEFTKHGLIRDFLDVDTYFCDPHSPWQKGQVEKTNSMLHRFLPKNASIRHLDEKELMKIQHQLNSIPRKILGYRSPAELFNEQLAGVALRT